MSLYRFFKPVKKLPDPNGELSATISPEAIREANKEVSAAMEVSEQGNRKAYKQISDTLRARIGWYVLEHGNVAVVWKYSDDFDAALTKVLYNYWKNATLKLEMK